MKRREKEKISRQPMPEQRPETTTEFRGGPLGYTPETGCQGGRAVPPVQEILPAWRDARCRVDIPGFIRLIKRGVHESHQKIWERNALPAVCGRVCPQEVQCEGPASLGKRTSRWLSATWNVCGGLDGQRERRAPSQSGSHRQESRRGGLRAFGSDGCRRPDPEGP